MGSRHLSIDDCLQGIRERDSAALGQVITLVESNRSDDRTQAQELLTRLLPLTSGHVRRPVLTIIDYELPSYPSFPDGTELVTTETPTSASPHL